jgi:NAD(P)H-hydrate repair Nnr-like enzyme with NAD(P)H-hydrate dehydratase domain
MLPWTARMDAMVVGPGLGQDDLIVRTTATWLRQLRDSEEERRQPVVIDGDGIHVLLQNPDLLVPAASSASASSASSAVAASSSFARHLLLTPNAMEFRRLWTKFRSTEKPPEFNVPREEHEEFLKERQSLLWPREGARSA